MELLSSAFKNKENIPSKYTCDGKNISPPLEFKNIPPKTKSLVLIMEDPDIPDFVKEKFKIEMWDHWIVWDIPIYIKIIEEGENPSGIVGKNTRGKNEYGSPCPPDREHRYFFKLFALDCVLNLPNTTTKKDLQRAMQGHILDEAQLVGMYKR